MHIRELNVNDYDAYLVLINDFRPTMFTKQQFIYTLQKINLSSKIFVIEDNKKLIGTATIQFEHKFIFNLVTLAHIEDVCIKEDLRGTGLGKQLLLHCVNEAKNHNAYKVTLDCGQHNIPFYTKCGFEQRGTQMTILLYDPSA